jgi:anti-sigma B factor antagonist
MTFNTSVRQSGDVAILDISGRIVLGDGSKQLSGKIKELLGAGNHKILLNLAEVAYVDSSGLGEMVSSYTNATAVGGKIKLLNAQPRIVELLKITKLHALFELFNEESQAVASFEEQRKVASA